MPSSNLTFHSVVTLPSAEPKAIGSPSAERTCARVAVMCPCRLVPSTLMAVVRWVLNFMALLFLTQR
jgi:hypothetical protein